MERPEKKKFLCSLEVTSDSHKNDLMLRFGRKNISAKIKCDTANTHRTAVSADGVSLVSRRSEPLTSSDMAGSSDDTCGTKIFLGLICEKTKHTVSKKNTMNPDINWPSPTLPRRPLVFFPVCNLRSDRPMETQLSKDSLHIQTAAV